MEPFDSHGADFVFGDFGGGIESGAGQDIGARLGQFHKGDEDLTRSDGIGQCGKGGRFAAAGDEADGHAAIETESLSILRVDGNLELRCQFKEFLNALGQRPAVPVVEAAAGIQGEPIVL